MNVLSSERIFITQDSLQELIRFLQQPFSACFVLVDENTLQHCYPFVKTCLPAHVLIQIQSGEKHKTISTCEIIWEELTNANADRKSLLINLGGGVISDIGGFAASCYKRGIAFINIPTTLLAMVDASVGGKTGVDFMGFKNQLGQFSEAEAVFVFTCLLETLPQRELISGFAEVIKHYLIADRESFFEITRSGLTNDKWPEVVVKNIKIKSAIVEQDPSEKGVRKALNYGHTVGHAIESWSLKNEKAFLLHGEAVAVGILAESFLSLKKGLLNKEDLNEIESAIKRYFKLVAIPQGHITEIMALIKQDKKNEHETTQFTLLQNIGNYSINNTVEEELVIESLNYYNSLCK